MRGQADASRESACPVPTIRTGTSGTPVASASRAAPRVHTPPVHRALREDRNRLRRPGSAPPRGRSRRTPRARARPVPLPGRPSAMRPAGSARAPPSRGSAAAAPTRARAAAGRAPTRGWPRRHRRPLRNPADDLDPPEQPRDQPHRLPDGVVERYAQNRSSSAPTSSTQRPARGIGTVPPQGARKAIGWIAPPITVRSASTPRARARS